MRKIIILLLLILSSCYHNIHTGKVIGCYYHPSFTYISYITCGKTTVPITNYVSESWSITIEGEKDGKIYQSDYYVSENDCENSKIGDIMTFK